MRPGERDGENYYFVERETFERARRRRSISRVGGNVGHLYEQV